MKEIAVRYAEIEPGERFTIRHVPKGLPFVIENAVGHPHAYAIKAGDSDAFDARVCTPDWHPIGTIDLTESEVGLFFVTR
jgi:hypothetical protein